MTSETWFANAELILSTEVVRGAIRITDGSISAIDQGKLVPKGAIDCEGDFIAPGLVELHTDNLERHLSPRPGVNWPRQAALLAHDRELASTGITTVFDAMRVGSNRDKFGSHKPYARAVASHLIELRNANAFKISHHIHLRAEICSSNLPDELDEFSPDDHVGIVSLMDHSPGQRQFRDLEKLKRYYMSKHGFSDVEFDGVMDEHRQTHATYSKGNIKATLHASKRLNATLASHDDTTVGHVKEAYENGTVLAEFPTTIEAAQACQDHRLSVIMGAPNLVRGGSHSGNVSASELADIDCIDILSSDYVPNGLLLAANMLGDIWGDLPRGIRTVTSQPASKVGLTDRGQLQIGMRGDLIRFKMVDNHPVLRTVLANGEIVA